MLRVSTHSVTISADSDKLSAVALLSFLPFKERIKCTYWVRFEAQWLLSACTPGTWLATPGMTHTLTGVGGKKN